MATLSLPLGLTRPFAGYAAMALLVASACGSVVAQQAKYSVKDYALIYGTVWSPDNAPVAGVPVTIRRSTDKKPKWQLVSDRRGEFAQRVPPGKQDYIVEAEIKTPKGQPRPQVTVQIDDDERKDISLHLPAAAPNQK